MTVSEIIGKLEKYHPDQEVEFLIYTEDYPKLISDINVYHTTEIAENEIGSFIDVFDLESLSKEEMIDEIVSQNLLLIEINL